MSQPQAEQAEPTTQTQFNPLNYPQSLNAPAHVKAIAWHEHIPFARVLMHLLRPKIFVELGVHKGDSYLAICEMAAALKLDIACYGVDTWQGDQHAGTYDESVLQELRAYHDPLYGQFSRLVQSTFDDAVKYFADGSIELLHIDGLHTLDAVRHDWETWKPKVSRNGIVIFHDTNVRERDFGVWQLWQELRTQYRSFEFLHGHGLGVLAMGPNIPLAMKGFFAAGESQPDVVRNYFFTLGSRISLEAASNAQKSEIEALTAAVYKLRADLECKTEEALTLDKMCIARGDEIKRVEGMLMQRDAQIVRLDNLAASRQKELDEYDKSLRTNIEKVKTLSAELDAMRAEVERMRTESETLRRDLAKISGGSSFKIGRAITAPFRMLKG